MNHYSRLHTIARKFHLLGGVSSILEWDQETHMPPDGAPIRAEQLELLAGIIHKEKTGKKFSSALGKMIDLPSGKIISKELTPDQERSVQLFRKDYLQATALPNRFVEKFTKLSSQSIEAWRFAKQNNSFPHFLPFLEKIVAMCRQKCDYLGYKEHPYDALLDLYEPDLTAAEVTTLFEPLKNNITHLLSKICKAKQVDDHFLYGSFPRSKQVEFAHLLLEAVGYEKTRGALDFSVHPFSSASHPTDSRITTYIHPSSLMSSIFSVLHEAGHGLYEMGLPPEHYGTPLGEPLSMGMHESQSRWWEVLIGRSKPFWSHFFPKLKNLFELDVTLPTFYRAIHKVTPSFIRVEADEVTYPLHIILRFEIEKELISGSLKPSDLPEAWNEKMQGLFGLTPATNSQGCLQDIHWSMGGIGYFPSYTLGNIYASHLFQGFAQQFPDWEEKVANGQLLFIKQWLNENIHCYGRKIPCKELLKQATNKTFSTTSYTNYLKNKYSEIYKLD